MNITEYLKTDAGRILLAAVLGWFLAQAIKVLIAVFNDQGLKEGMRAIFKSGGMPSGHTASVVAATIATGKVVGMESAIFAVMATFAMVIIYDAVNVRWAVGEYGKVINKMSDKKELKVKIVEGHTIPQAIIGGMIGILVGVVV